MYCVCVLVLVLVFGFVSISIAFLGVSLCGPVYIPVPSVLLLGFVIVKSIVWKKDLIFLVFDTGCL